jgi:hypothetical protein
MQQINVKLGRNTLAKAWSSCPSWMIAFLSPLVGELADDHWIGLKFNGKKEDPVFFPRFSHDIKVVQG